MNEDKLEEDGVGLVVVEIAEDLVEVELVLLKLGEVSTVDLDSTTEVELVGCVLMVVEAGIIVVELVIGVVEEGGIAVGRTVVNAIVVDVGSQAEAVDGNGTSQILYSHCTVYEPGVRRSTCNNINSKLNT